MNLQTLSAHTIDIELLPEAPRVLDVGCRNWDFTDDILRLRPKARITALDPGHDIHPHPNEAHVKYLRCALVGDNRKQSWYTSFSTGEANYLISSREHAAGKPVHLVGCVNIQDLGEKLWDAVKLDCEGSEFEILQKWPGPIARQISVELHDWDKLYAPDNRQWDVYYDELFGRLQRLFGYRVVQHELSKQGEGIGHWDSLLVLDK